ncbi:MAG: NUMOD3 domain-containing DNA-binding protein [Candidatus Odinarchaeia archaeon]
MQHEIDMHEAFDVGRNDEFYNKCKQTTTGFDIQGVKLPPPAKETIAKRKLTIKNKSAEEIAATNRKKSESRIGRKESEYTKILKSQLQAGEKNSFYGKKHTEE